MLTIRFVGVAPGCMESSPHAPVLCKEKVGLRHRLDFEIAAWYDNSVKSSQGAAHGCGKGILCLCFFLLQVARVGPIENLGDSMGGCSRHERSCKRYLNILALLGLWSCCLCGEAFITQAGHGGRFGDQLLLCMRTEMLARRFGLTFLHRSFPYSDQLVLHDEQRCPGSHKEHFDEAMEFSSFAELAQAGNGSS